MTSVSTDCGYEVRKYQDYQAGYLQDLQFTPTITYVFKLIILIFEGTKFRSIKMKVIEELKKKKKSAQN